VVMRLLDKIMSSSHAGSLEAYMGKTTDHSTIKGKPKANTHYIIRLSLDRNKRCY